MESTEDAAYRPLLGAYLAGLERALPAETVAGVYLTGSIALDDYRHGSSDLDILTLITRPLADAELDALETLHKELRADTQPYADATYASRDHIGKLPPEDAPGEAYVVDGVFHRGVGHGSLVSWATLDQRGITLRGPEAKALGAAPDPAEFTAWNRAAPDDHDR